MDSDREALGEINKRQCQRMVGLSGLPMEVKYKVVQENRHL